LIEEYIKNVNTELKEATNGLPKSIFETVCSFLYYRKYLRYSYNINPSAYIAHKIFFKNFGARTNMWTLQ